MRDTEVAVAPPRPRHAVDDALVAVEEYTNSPVLNRIVRKGIFMWAYSYVLERPYANSLGENLSASYGMNIAWS